jgi:hypothetical protein
MEWLSGHWLHFQQYFQQSCIIACMSDYEQQDWISWSVVSLSLWSAEPVSPTMHILTQKSLLTEVRLDSFRSSRFFCHFQIVFSDTWLKYCEFVVFCSARPDKFFVGKGWWYLLELWENCNVFWLQFFIGTVKAAHS